MLRRRALLVAGLAVVLAGGLAGCAGFGSLEDRVDVGIADVALARPGLLEQTLAVRLSIRNLEPADLSVAGARFELWIEGERIGVGTAKGDLVVPGLESVELPGELTIDTLDMVQRLASLRSGRLDYTIQGVLFTGGSFLGRTPFTTSGRIDVGSALQP